MQQLDSFLSTLQIYIESCEKMFIYEQEFVKEKRIELNNGLFEGIYKYIQVKNKITSIHKNLISLKKNDKKAYALLALDFFIMVTTVNSPLKKEFDELNQSYQILKIPNNSWTDVFLNPNPNYATFLQEDFPFDEISKPQGGIYKKFVNLLYLSLWIDSKLDVITNKSEPLANALKEQLSHTEDVASKFESIELTHLDAYKIFINRMEEVNSSADFVLATQEKGQILLNELENKKQEVNTLLTSLDIYKTDTESLISTNKDLSSHLTSKEMSSTFLEASTYYNDSKQKKLFWIMGVGAILLLWSFFILVSFDIEKMISLENTPLVLIMYTTPKLFILVIISWILKFLMSDYKKEADTALDFKHRQAVSDVTPGFRKQLDDKDKQDDLVGEAFNVLLTTSKEDNKHTLENKLIIENLIDLLSNNEVKNTFLKMIDNLKNTVTVKKKVDKEEEE